MKVGQPNCCFVHKRKKLIHHLIKRHIFERKYYTIRTKKRAVLWIFETNFLGNESKRLKTNPIDRIEPMLTSSPFASYVLEVWQDSLQDLIIVDHQFDIKYLNWVANNRYWVEPTPPVMNIWKSYQVWVGFNVLFNRQQALVRRFSHEQRLQSRVANLWQLCLVFCQILWLIHKMSLRVTKITRLSL